MKFLNLLIILILFSTVNFAQLTQNQTYEAEKYGYFISPIETPYGIVFTDNFASKIYLYNFGKVKVLVETAGCGRYFSVSTDGKYISYKSIIENGKQAPAYFNLEEKKAHLISAYSQRCNQITIHDEKNLQKISNLKFKNTNLTPISPSGNYVVYDNNQEYFILLNLQTKKEKKLPNDGNGVIYPKWSPDSKKILFQNREMELLVFEIETKKLYKLGKGGAGNWDANSKNIVFQKTDVTNFILNKSEIYISDYKGLNIRQLTNTPDVYEMTPSFGLNYDILYQTYNKRQIIKAKLNVLKSYFVSYEILLDNPKNLSPKFYDTSKFNTSKSITHLTNPVPYIHQKYDAPTGRNGDAACAPTTSMMALAYYNRLPKWHLEANNFPSITGTDHYCDYSGYILDKYKYNEFYFNAYSSSKNAFGGYAYMWVSPYSSPGGGDGMRNFQNLHDMESGSYVWLSNATFQKTCDEIDNEYPHPICSWITHSGHLKLAIGYVNNQHTLIFNDPWGNKNTEGYPSYDGADAYYDWPGYNNGYQNLDPDGTHGTIAWTLTARSSEPEYDNLKIENTSYNHGFYMNNTEGGAKQRYYRHIKNNAGSNGHIWWTGGVGTSDADVCWVTWTPNLSETNNYKVEAYIPATFSDSYSTVEVTSSAYYKIFHAGGSTNITINQHENQGTWVDLGTYSFLQGENSYVYLGDVVDSSDDNKKVLFDAVRYTVSTNVNLSEKTKTEINVFPNPTTDIVNITSKKVIINLKIIDSSGKIIYQKKKIALRTFKIDLSNYNAGIYFIKVNTKDKVISQKIILK